MDLTDIRTSFGYFKRLCIMYALLVKVDIFRHLHVYLYYLLILNVLVNPNDLSYCTCKCHTIYRILYVCCLSVVKRSKMESTIKLLRCFS